MKEKSKPGREKRKQPLLTKEEKRRQKRARKNIKGQTIGKRAKEQEEKRRQERKDADDRQTNKKTDK